MSLKRQRILIVDDSPFIRRMLRDWLSAEPDLEVIGEAKNGEEGLTMAAAMQPDVVTLDVQMPGRTGLQVLPEMLATGSHVLMCSSVTQEGAAETLKALEIGAYDFVTKPQGGASLKFVGSKEEVVEKVRAARYARRVPQTARVTPPVRRMGGSSDRVVLIASSTGGPKTLAQLWQSLPKGFPAPILMVQHMPQGFTKSFAQRLDSFGTVPCCEAEQAMKIEPGHAYLAPGGMHMRVTPEHRLQLFDGPTMHGVKPAADHLFVTASQIFGSRCIGVVLTGMGKDGAEGALAVRRAGGTTLGECEASCAVYGMPKAAKLLGGIEDEFSIEEMAAAITVALNKGVRHAS